MAQRSLTTPQSKEIDSVALTPVSYGLRIGIDMSSLIRTVATPDYTGFMALADYRISPNSYLAGEIGNEEISRESDRLDYQTKGTFFKAGVDYNLFDNWKGMDNLIYVGGRLGAAQFSQTLSRYEFNADSDFFPLPDQEVERTTDGLNALWLELHLGVKVEVLSQLFIIANVQLRHTLSESTPPNFDNLYIPGFGRTYDTTDIGTGFTYGIMYKIPFYKK